MRFYTFIKNNKQLLEDKNASTFLEWFINSNIGKNNKQVGVPQLVIFMRLNTKNIPENAKIGFGVCLMAYYNEPKNMLPKEWKQDHKKIQNITQVVFFPLEDDFFLK